MANTPVDFGTRGFGDYGAIPNAVADYCYGPEIYGVPDYPDQPFTRWVAWKAADGIRILKNPPTPFQPSSSTGALSGLFDGDTDYTKLSIAFEQNGLPVIAVERSDKIELRRFVGDVPVAFEWSVGKSPLVFFNGEVEYETPLTDAVCYYLSPDGDKIFVRVQRENYATPHEMNSSLNASLDRLTKVDRVGERVVIWAMSTGSLRSEVVQSVLISQLHDLWPVRFQESSSQSISWSGGLYVLQVIPAPSQSDSASQSVTWVGGDYIEPIIPEDVGVEEASQFITLQGGSYDAVIVNADPVSDSANQSVTWVGGEYELVIGATVEETDSANQSVTWVGGSYT